MTKNKDYKTSIGGQALIEGVMMRSAKKVSTAVRRPDGGIELKIDNLRSIKDKIKILKLPLLRGMVSLVESLIYGYKTLMYSAEVAGFEDDKPKQELEQEENAEDNKAPEAKGTSKIWFGLTMALSIVLALALSVGLFMLLPATVVKLASDVIELGVFKALIEGLIRIGLFVLYIALVSKMKDIQRVFMYHGAEHKAIFCFEAGEDLTVENVRTKKRLHPRCGTSFLLIVLILGILAFSFVTWSSILYRTLIKLSLMPLLVGVSFEISRFTGRHDNILTRIISAPGMALQRLTTKEPDDSQIEVAIAALEAVIPQNREEEKW